MKKFVSIFLSIIISLSSLTLAFADDLETEFSVSSSSATDVVTYDSISSVNSDVIVFDNNLREAASLMAAAASEYTANDIYTLLASLVSSGKFKVSDSSLLSELVLVYNQLHFGSLSVADMLQQLYVSIPDFVNTFGLRNTSDPTVYDMIFQMYVSLGGNMISSSAEGVWGYLISISSGIDDIVDALSPNGSVDSHLYDIYSRLNQIFTVLQNTNALLGSDPRTGHLYSKLNDIKSALDIIHSDLSSSNSFLSHIDSDFHDLKQWFEETFYFSFEDSNFISAYGCRVSNATRLFPLNYVSPSPTVTSDSEYFNNIILSSDLISEHIDITYSISPSINISDFHFDKSASGYYDYLTIRTYNVANNSFGPYLNFYQDASYSFDVSNNIPVVHWYLKGVSSFVSSNPSDYYFLNLNTAFNFDMPYSGQDFSGLIGGVVVSSQSYLSYYKDWMDKYTSLYMSDDLIEAKEAQQEFEDTALEDFTGEGSASASVNDLGSLSNISSTVKGGLSTGHSVSEGLSIFNSNSGLWSFFSQQNYDVLNTLSSGSGGTRNSKSGSSTPYYDQNLYDLMGEWHEYYE